MVINWNRTDSMSRFTTVTSIVLPKMRWSNLWRAQKPKVVWTEDEEIARIHSVLTLCISFWLFIMYEMRCVPNFQHYCYYYYLFIRLHIGTGFHITFNWLTHKIKHKRIYSDRIRCIIHFLQIGNREHDRFAIQMAFSPLRFILQKTDENITARDVHLTLNHNQKLIKLAFTGTKYCRRSATKRLS